MNVTRVYSHHLRPRQPRRLPGRPIGILSVAGRMSCKREQLADMLGVRTIVVRRTERTVCRLAAHMACRPELPERMVCKLGQLARMACRPELLARMTCKPGRLARMSYRLELLARMNCTLAVEHTTGLGSMWEERRTRAVRSKLGAISSRTSSKRKLQEMKNRF